MIEKVSEQERSSSTGLLRDVLAHEGLTLAEAFDKVRESDALDWCVEDSERRRMGAHLDVARVEGSGYFDVCRFADEFYFVACDISFSEEHTEYVPGDGLLEFHVRLDGELNVMTSRTTPLQLSGPSLLVWSIPEGQSADESIPAQRYKSISIYFEPTHILNHFIRDPEKIPINLARFMLSRDDSINYCNLPINPDIISAANALLTASERFQGLLWLNYAHAKSEELICIIIESFDQLSSAAEITFTEREINHLRQARDIAVEEIGSPPTIKDIAHRIGTNETKLKQGFRAMYGETIFEYRNRKRMELTVELLLAGKPLAAISDQVGFKHQTSFTTAFKTYFGVSPKEYRRRR